MPSLNEIIASAAQAILDRIPTLSGGRIPVATVDAADVTAGGNITTQNLVPAGVATAGSAVELTVAGRDTCAVQVSAVGTGILSIQGTVDGTNWVTLGGTQVQRTSDGLVAATIPSGTTGIWLVGCGAFQKIRVTALAPVTGTYTVSLRAVDGNALMALDSPIPAGTNAIGNVGISGTPTVNSSPVSPTSPAAAIVSTASSTGVNLKSSAGAVYELTAANPTATPAFLKLYNKATAPTTGTDVPVMTIPLAANSLVSLNFGVLGKRFTLGIGYAFTAAIAATDTAAPVAGLQFHPSYI